MLLIAFVGLLPAIMAVDTMLLRVLLVVELDTVKLVRVIHPRPIRDLHSAATAEKQRMLTTEETNADGLSFFVGNCCSTKRRL